MLTRVLAPLLLFSSKEHCDTSYGSIAPVSGKEHEQDDTSFGSVASLPGKEHDYTSFGYFTKFHVILQKFNI